MDCYFKLIRNPWPDRVPDDKMRSVLASVMQVRALHINAMLERGDIDDPSFGWCIMDPTAPISRASEESILALAWVGPYGQLRLDNAIAKAFALRDHGLTNQQSFNWRSWDPDGQDEMLCADGEFRWPGGVIHVGLIIGGSGFSVRQDVEQNQEFANSLDSCIRHIMLEWAEEHPRQGDPHWSWFCNENKPGSRFSYEQYLGGNWLVGQVQDVTSFKAEL